MWATWYRTPSGRSAYVSSGLTRPRVDRNLNTVVPWLEGQILTAESPAGAYCERIRSALSAGALRSVRVWETDRNWVEVGDPV
jgi:hypothetical protein